MLIIQYSSILPPSIAKECTQEQERGNHMDNSWGIHTVAGKVPDNEWATTAADTST